jgi:hypothetical protein
MKVERKIDEKGNVSIVINDTLTFVIGITTYECREYSRKLCGYTHERGSQSIFSPDSEICLYYGEFEQHIPFGTRLDYVYEDLKSIAEKLVTRVKTVKKWIQECKSKAGVVEVIEKEEILNTLKKNNKCILYQDAQGKFRRLEI